MRRLSKFIVKKEKRISPCIADNKNVHKIVLFVIFMLLLAKDYLKDLGIIYEDKNSYIKYIIDSVQVLLFSLIYLLKKLDENIREVMLENEILEKVNSNYPPQHNTIDNLNYQLESIVTETKK